MSNTIGGAVEIDLASGNGWGGDFSLDATGDLVLAQDTTTAPNATQQRLTRLILTNASLSDQNGNPIGWADDLFHPNWGASLRAYVDGAFTDQTLQSIAQAVRQQLAADPAVANIPIPIVNLTQTGTYAATLQITFWTINGQKQVLPTIALTPTNVQIAV